MLRSSATLVQRSFASATVRKGILPARAVHRNMTTARFVQLRSKDTTIQKTRSFSSTAKSTPSSPPIASEVTDDMRMRNVALACVLMAFCFGVASYSMRAVGQAGDDSEDPLAELRKEAAMAQQQQQSQQQSEAKANEMLQQFQAGEYDPDAKELQELEEEEELSKNQKRRWWKFW